MKVKDNSFVLPAVVAKIIQTGLEEEVFLPVQLLSPSASGASPPAASELQLPTAGSKRGNFKCNQFNNQVSLKAEYTVSK